MQDETGVDDMDDFDLLEATIDERDQKTLMKVKKLEEEIEYEKTLINCKKVFRLSFGPDDPFGNAKEG